MAEQNPTDILDELLAKTEKNSALYKKVLLIKTIHEASDRFVKKLNSEGAEAAIAELEAIYEDLRIERAKHLHKFPPGGIAIPDK